MFVIDRLSVGECQEEELAADLDKIPPHQAQLSAGGILKALTSDGYRSALTSATLAAILYCSLALNHQLPSLSMPPAYKEEKTDPALTRSCSALLILRRLPVITL
ncbi:hypothetical protein [Pseudomonas sp. NPDC086251]|uniref:hypothetical protein n=1 Tax=Pseudomonas sp. NPDC086251 TaxID=3364431 RepID=UPI003834B467